MCLTVGTLPINCHRQHTVWNCLSPPPDQGCQALGGHQCHVRHILPPLRQPSALQPPGKPRVEGAHPCPGIRQEPVSQSHAPEPPWSSWCGGHWGKTLQGEQEQAPGHQPAFPGCLESSTLPGSKVGLGTNPWDKVRKQSPGHGCWGSHGSPKAMGDQCLALPQIKFICRQREIK